MTPVFLAAVLADRRDEGEQALGSTLPDGFPSEGERRFLALRLRQMQEDVRFETWCPHAIDLRGEMIGHAGYHGPPGANAARAPNAVEFGYTIFEPYRGHGSRSEAARMLIELARDARRPSFDPLCFVDERAALAIATSSSFVRDAASSDARLEDGLELIRVASRRDE